MADTNHQIGKNKPRKCLQCGKQIRGRETKKFCSVACRSRHHNWRKWGIATLGFGQCDQCGKPVRKVRRGQRFCSSICRARWAKHKQPGYVGLLMRILGDVEASDLARKINAKFAEIDHKFQEVEEWIKTKS
jgi:hypothetical protein